MIDIINSVQQEKVYDLAKDHFLGEFPSSLPIEKAYLHIGIYLGWVVDQKLYSDFFAEEAATEIFRFRRREIGPTVLSEIWDGRLSHGLFNKEGNLFTYYYYAGGIFKKDYVRILADSAPSLYHVQDNWENYGKISQRISDRFSDWEKIVE